MSAAADLTAEQVLGPDEFKAHGYPHAAWKTLRRDAPVRYFDMGPRPGFWAVTRRDDIVWLSKQPTKFLNAPRVAVFADSPPPDPTKPNRAILRHLLNMDPPDHAEYRNLASAWFTPRAIARRRPEIERIADDLVDEIAQKDEIDFVEDFGPHPLGPRRHARRPAERLAPDGRMDEPDRRRERSGVPGRWR